MQEETGYIIDKFVPLPLPQIFCDPWKSNETGLLYIGLINGDDEKSKKQQNLEEEENIKVFTLPFD